MNRTELSYNFSLQSISSSYYFIKPIDIFVEKIDEYEYRASLKEVEEWVYGISFQDALTNLFNYIIQIYEAFSDQSVISEYSNNIFVLLQNYLSKK